MTSRMLTPFREMMSLREAMNRLFDESFFEPSLKTFNGGYAIDVDVEARNDEFILHANVPGLKPENLHIEVSENTVTLRGQYQEEKKTDGDFLMLERRYGQFSRTISLPAPVNPDKAEAVVENGVLRLRLPKTEKARPRAITVKAQAG